ncbi:MAG: U32 family peptidase, partial [Clostridiaceae bacterium]|nr:U32 family peptidase [Clostridiaceae bacterium]
ERILEQLGKTGQTPFEFKKVEMDIGDNLSLPVSEINNMRREALNELEIKRASRYKRNAAANLKFSDMLLNFPGNNRNKKNNIKISACFYKLNEEIDLAKLEADRLYIPLNYFIGQQSRREIIELIKEKGKEVFVFIPPITRGNYDRLLKARLKEITETGIDGFLAGNAGTLGIAGNYENISLMADYSLNVFNNAALTEIVKLGACGATLSYELTLSQIGSFSDVEGFVKEVLVYGRIPLMMSEYCPAGSIHGNFSAASECSRVCSRGNYFLKDRIGMKFPVMCDRVDCRSTVFNANVLLMADSLEKIKAAGADMVRLNFVDESPLEIEAILRMHGDILKNGSSSVLKHEKLLNEIKEKGFTKGHYFRGV